MRTDARRAGGTYLLLLVLAILFAGPFAWLVLAALKQPSEWVAIPIHFLPAHWQWANFHQALTQINFPAYLGNSLFLSSLYAVLVTLSSVRLHLVDTYWPWVLWGLAASPYLVFLFRQFFAAIPGELEDAAILDGCGYGRR